MENGRISGGQLVAIMFWTIMGTAVITLPIMIALHAPRTAWMGAVIFAVGGTGLCLIIGAIANMQAGLDFVQYVQTVFGKWLGKLLILIFLAWLFHSITLVINQVTNFTQISLLPNTPLLTIQLFFLAPSIYAVYLGLEAVARSGQFLFFISIGVFILLFMLIIPDFNSQNLLPLFDEGISKVLRSGVTPLAWAGQIMFVLFLVPFVKSQKKIAVYAALTIALIGLAGIGNEMMYTAVFGPLRQHLINPFYALIRYVQPTAFVERYDILFVAVNLVGNFIKLSVFIYVFVLALAQVLGLKSYRPLLIPAAIGQLVLVALTPMSPPELIHFFDTLFPLFTIPVLYGFPLLVLVAGKIRKAIIPEKRQSPNHE